MTGSAVGPRGAFLSSVVVRGIRAVGSIVQSLLWADLPFRPLIFLSLPWINQFITSYFILVLVFVSGK